MMTPSPATDARANLERQWGMATLEVTRAQGAYAELISRAVSDEEAEAAACLRLWRAQERQRELSSELDRLEM